MSVPPRAPAPAKRGPAAQAQKVAEYQARDDGYGKLRVLQLEAAACTVNVI